MKKLLYIQDHLGLGGISTVVSIKQNWLVVNGYHVANLFTHHEPQPDIEKLYNPQIKIHSISLAQRQAILSIPVVGRIVWFIYFRIQFLKVLFKINPDIIISTHQNLEPTSVILATFWKRRILEFHISGTRKATDIRTWLLYNIKFRFYKLVCLTEGDARDKKYFTGQEAIVIPNPKKKYDGPISNCLNKRVVIPSRFNEQKGLVPFLPHWKEIETRHPDWGLHLYGAGPEKETLEQIKNKNNLTTVFFHEYSTTIYSKIAESSILLLPSMYEGFPTTLVEAMTCGVPCVAFDCNYGPSDIIKDGEDGYVVEFKNYKQFIERIEKLIDDQQLRISMGMKAKTNIARYEVERIMPLWVDLFGKQTSNR